MGKTNTSILSNDWEPLLRDEFSEEYYSTLRQFLKQEYSRQTIFPDMYDIFNALHWTGYAQTKVVILGQDPYHGPGQAHGLSFSVKPGIQPPPSLQNIYKELYDDLGLPIPRHGYLKHWAEQGVLLLNTVLTVRAGAANSHRGMGWERFTDRVFELLNEREQPLVFILWGAQAQAKRQMIDQKKHGIIASPHPSPLSSYRGFFGSRPFSRTNELLRKWGIAEIDWSLPENIS